LKPLDRIRAPGRAGPIVLAAGILLIAAAQALAPVAAPLFDSLTVLSIAPLFARAIRAVFSDGSVTDLFGGVA